MTGPVTRWCKLPAYLVRMAGFAFERLAPLGCARAAALEAALADAITARAAAGHALDDALDRERYADNPAFDDPAARKALARCIKQARAFARTPADAPPPAEALREVVRVVPRVAGLAAELERSHARWREAERAFAAAFPEDLEQARRALRHLYLDERLQEAVFLQSAEAYEGIQKLAATAGPRNQRARQRERVAMMYAQRFCAKNDTNSICGPIGVGYATGGATACLEITVEDARRETYFSHWAAQRLLDEAVRRADGSPATLRLHPMARVDDRAVAWCAIDYDGSTFRRRHLRSELPEAGARLLQALAHPRGRTKLGALAGELGLGTDELAEFLDQLIETGLVLRGPQLPPGLFHPLRAVAAEVERWPPSAARAWALSEVAGFEELIAEFARAPLAGRIALFQQIGARFEHATGGTATRGKGSHYADRSLLHEDGYVELRADLGEAGAALDTTLPVLAAALELPIECRRERAREWFRARFGEGVRISVPEVHRAFDEERVLDTPAATPRAMELSAAIERVRELIARAAAAAGGGEVRITERDLRGALAGLEPPANPAYVSVDALMRRLPGGEVELVLGEVHSIFWISSCAFDIMPPEHRERVLGQMRAAVDEMAKGRRAAEGVFLHMQTNDRRFPLAPIDLQLLALSERPGALDLGALDLRLVGDDFEFLAGDEEIIPLVAFNRYELLYLFGKFAPMFDHHADRFFPDALLPAALRGGDVPRLGIDRIVFQRRAWRRPVPWIREALTAEGEAELFKRAQALRRELGCGRHVFVSVPGQPKPVLLDFHNVFLLEALANMLAGAPDGATIKIGEMLPGPDELVARGPDGLRTSELRLGFYRV